MPIHHGNWDKDLTVFQNWYGWSKTEWKQEHVCMYCFTFLQVSCQNTCKFNVQSWFWWTIWPIIFSSNAYVTVIMAYNLPIEIVYMIMMREVRLQHQVFLPGHLSKALLILYRCQDVVLMSVCHQQHVGWWKLLTYICIQFFTFFAGDVSSNIVLCSVWS